MLIEMRRYAVRPGHMDEMHARMRHVLFPLFAQHNVPEPLAIWENRADTSTLTWLIAWPDFDARQAAWAAVVPAFAAVRLVNAASEFVTRTTLTLIAPWPGAEFTFPASADACETVWHVQPQIGFGAGFMAMCGAGIADRLHELGAMRIAGCNLIFGALPQAAVFISWPDAETRAAAMTAFIRQSADPTLAEALTGEADPLGDRGDWETLDRVTYLPRWTGA